MALESTLLRISSEILVTRVFMSMLTPLFQSSAGLGCSCLCWFDAFWSLRSCCARCSRILRSSFSLRILSSSLAVCSFLCCCSLSKCCWIRLACSFRCNLSRISRSCWACSSCARRSLSACANRFLSAYAR